MVKILHCEYGICEFTCHSLSGLRKHTRNIHGEHCEMCPKRFSSITLLQVHINIEHKRLEVNNAPQEKIVISRRIGEHSSYRIPDDQP